MLSTVPRTPQGTGETPRNQSLSSGTAEGSQSTGKKLPGGVPHKKPSLVLRDPKGCAQPACPLLGSAPIEGLVEVCPCRWSGGSGREALSISPPATSPPWGPGNPQLPPQSLVEGTHSSPRSSKVPGKLPAASKDSILRTGTEGPWKNLTPQLLGETPPHLFCHQRSVVCFHLFSRGDAMGHLSQLRGPRGPSVITTLGQELHTVTKHRGNRPSFPPGRIPARGKHTGATNISAYHRRLASVRASLVVQR